MEKGDFPKVNRSYFKISRLADKSDEPAFWQSKTPLERLDAIEIMRQIIYGYNPSTTRLQRVLEIAQLNINETASDKADLEKLP